MEKLKRESEGIEESIIIIESQIEQIKRRLNEIKGLDIQKQKNK